jgi:DNA (cytosine-5)-methyltransferase 1
MHYAELFAGAGGMSIGLEAAGWTCVAHAEIEPHARAVLRKQWPDVPLYGDVTQLDGRQFKGITMLTGGSPCQDLSIAGKRAGMADGTRSSLFFEQMRIWRESEAPLVLWENVMGAFSSNGGQDFGAVLQSIVGGTVAVPADGWRNAGVASGPTGVAAWRALDLQHFGWDGHTTPQRRRRVFVLGVRAGALDPAEVLLVRDGLLGNLETCKQASENAAPNAGAGVAGAVGVFGSISHALTHEGADASEDGTGRGTPVVVQTAPATGAGAAATFDVRNVTSRANRSRVELGRPSQTLHAGGLEVLTYTPTQYAQYAEGVGTLRANGGDLGGGSESLVLTYDARGNGEGAIANTLSGDHQNRVTDYTALVLRSQVQGVDKQQGIGFSDTSPTLKTDLAHQMGPVVSVSEATAFNWQSGGDVRLEPRTEQANTLQSNQTQAVILRNREGKPGGGKGPLLSEGKRLTLGTANDQVVFTRQRTDEFADGKGVVSTILARDYKRASDVITGNVGIPRRLMPIECERLMGWPSGWTERGIDEQGREYTLSDTARYKLCGNGCGGPVLAWIGLQLSRVLDKKAPERYSTRTPSTRRHDVPTD